LVWNKASDGIDHGLFVKIKRAVGAWHSLTLGLLQPRMELIELFTLLSLASDRQQYTFGQKMLAQQLAKPG
jgi:hypothetical protein